MATVNNLKINGTKIFTRTKDLSIELGSAHIKILSYMSGGPSMAVGYAAASLSLIGSVVNIAANTNVTGNFTSTGNITTSAGYIQAAGSVTAGSALVGNSLNVTTDATIGNNLVVNNEFTAKGLSKVVALTATGAVTINSTLNTTGKVTINNALQVTGETSTGTFKVTGNADIGGTLLLSKATGISNSSYSGPALVVGGLSTANHLEFDYQRIQAKSGTDIQSDLYLNPHGGSVYVGTSGLTVLGTSGSDIDLNNGVVTADLFSGNASTATLLQTARNITIGSQTKSFNGSANIAFDLATMGASAVGHTHEYLPLSGGVVTGDIEAPAFIGALTGNADTATKIIGSVAAASSAEIIRYQMGANDYFRVLVGGADNAGYVEFATADDKNESILFRQYQGIFTGDSRTLTLLDSSGNTTFPGAVATTGFLDADSLRSRSSWGGNDPSGIAGQGQLYFKII